MRKIILLAVLASITFHTWSQPLRLPEKEIMTFGVYYYPEHWKKEQWERDIKKMSELGFEWVHMGEFAWAFMEPEEGKFNFGWLDTCVALCEKYKLKIVLCTPSPCPPAWLTAKLPEILCVNDNGVQIKHGTRLQANGSNPKYQFYTKRINLELAKRYGKNPNVLGWQIGNEPHFAPIYDYSQYSQDEFKVWLKNKYKNITALNDAWGTAFWSVRFNNFEQIRIPNAKEGFDQPHPMLDYQRFNAEQLAKANRFEAEIMKQNIDKSQWVTTNFAYYKFLTGVDLFLNRKDFDHLAHTMYPMSTWLNYTTGSMAYRLGSGMELSFSTEFAKSMTGQTGIMELQPGQINWGGYNAQPLPGAVRMWIWHCFGTGDSYVATYRFRQPIYGGELYHNGIMETDGVTVQRGGQEYVQAIKEIKNLRKQLDINAKMPMDYASRLTAFQWKQDNLYDIQNAKHNNDFDVWQHQYTYYENLKTIGAGVKFFEESDVVDPKQYPFLVAPAYQLVNPEIIKKWKTYVENGGNLILSTRTGQKDNNGHLHEALLQQPIWDLIGAKIEYNDQLPSSASATVTMDNKDFAWSVWGEIITPNNETKTLATYKDQFYAGKSAVISRKLGKGTVTYIGVWTKDRELEKQVLRKVYEQAGATILNQSNYVFTEWRQGFWVTVNYTSSPVQAPVHEGSTIIYGTKEVQPGGVCVWKTK